MGVGISLILSSYHAHMHDWTEGIFNSLSLLINGGHIKANSVSQILKPDVLWIISVYLQVLLLLLVCHLCQFFQVVPAQTVK